MNDLGELMIDGFVALNQMEVDDNEGDVSDSWVTLNSFGFNKQLVLDQVLLKHAFSSYLKKLKLQINVKTVCHFSINRHYRLRSKSTRRSLK